MAYVYKTMKGVGTTRGGKTEKVVASMDGVQDWLDDYILLAGMRAEEELIEHKFDDHAHIDIEEGDIDRYLILNDERGQGAAMSIEYGRDAYGIDADGNVVNPTSPEAIYTVGAMDGLFILHHAVKVKPHSMKGTGGRKHGRLS